MAAQIGVAFLYMALLVAAYVAGRGTVLLVEEMLLRARQDRLNALLTWWGYPAGAVAVTVATLVIVSPAGQGAVAVAFTAGMAVGGYLAAGTFNKAFGAQETVYDWKREGDFPSEGTPATVVSLADRRAAS